MGALAPDCAPAEEIAKPMARASTVAIREGLVYIVMSLLS
jgi:hypothetical protein